MFQTALKYNLEVTQTRRVDFPVPFSAGAKITVFVISEQPVDNFNDLLAASQSSLDFWDNSFDDEDWNHV
ncbi:MAG: hypothetical protein DRR00_22020 [Candidatus Parabeggiatoa sp. nov. 3]|jgi:hypothetical protein|nr:MAG: hypothetical protein DRR00_22020 [Gammaproteobacteria bacterium]RKZ61806.1 MAG: hypothetical protein DRQ99_19780 [Gammaproteobacteria bacterium]